jgi:hypothetical protein
MADLAEHFRKAERLEMLAAELYRLIASGMSETSNAHTVLLKLAQEEDEHAMRVRMLQSRFEGRMQATIAFDTSALDRLIDEGETLKRLLTAEGGITREEARRFMIEQERNFEVAHAHVLVPDEPELATFFAELAFQDQMHLKILEQLDLS